MWERTIDGISQDRKHLELWLPIKGNFCPPKDIWQGGSDGKESACNDRDPGLALGWEAPLEKGMATHSSILAWRIPWTEEPGGLQSMESQGVRHDWVTTTFTFKDILDFITERKAIGSWWVDVKWKSLSRVWLFATPWTIQSLEFSRPEF